jgi:hypothetical protein
MGDRRAGEILLLAHQHQGDWSEASRFSSINPDFFVYRPKALDEILPWDFLDHGIRKEHLGREYELALEAKESEVCHVGQCVRCGVCDLRTVTQTIFISQKKEFYQNPRAMHLKIN